MVWFESVNRVQGDSAPPDLLLRRMLAGAGQAAEMPPQQLGDGGGDKPTE